MAHYFETGAFSNGQAAWHILGKVLPKGEYMTPSNVLELCELTWRVNKNHLYLADGTVCPKAFCLQRDSDGKVIGLVGSDYCAFQNEEMLELATALAGYGVKFETGLSLKGGQIVTLLGRLNETQILGDKFFEYISFANYHSGGSRSVYMTGIREVCWNTHSYSRDGAKAEKRIWSKRHFKKSLALNEENLKEAREILKLAELHGDNLKKLAELLASKKMVKADWIKMAEHLFPDPTGSEEKPPSEEQKMIINEKRSLLFKAASAQDLENFKHTAWGGLCAVTTYTSHVTSGTKTTSEATQLRRTEDRFIEQMEGSKLEKSALDFLLQLA